MDCAFAERRPEAMLGSKLLKMSDKTEKELLRQKQFAINPSSNPNVLMSVGPETVKKESEE
jgi:hypothetical protein